MPDEGKRAQPRQMTNPESALGSTAPASDLCLTDARLV